MFFCAANSLECLNYISQDSKGKTFPRVTSSSAVGGEDYLPACERLSSEEQLTSFEVKLFFFCFD